MREFHDPHTQLACADYCIPASSIPSICKSTSRMYRRSFLIYRSVKTRIQAARDVKGHDDKTSITGILLKVIEEEGLAGLYKGFGATMLNTFSMRMSPIQETLIYWILKDFIILAEYAYFFFYSFVRLSYLKRLARKLPPGSKAPALSTVAELLLGAIAGALAQLCTIPVAVIATRQQIGRAIEHPRRRPSSRLGDIEKAETASSAASDFSDEEEPYDDSFFGVAREIIEEEGYSGLWLGIKPGLVLTVNPAITYGVYERVKNMVLLAREKAANGVAGSQKLGPWMTFLVGATSKSLATIVSITESVTVVLFLLGPNAHSS